MIHIVQCLCGEARHAIIAAAYDPADEAPGAPPMAETLERAVKVMIENNVIKPWCQLCGVRADHWRYEDAPTIFRTMAEAKPALELLEIEQAGARNLMSRN